MNHIKPDAWTQGTNYSWLGLANHNDNFSQTKCALVKQQHELILAANRMALKRMKVSAEKSVF